jgi:hypothetical protein
MNNSIVKMPYGGKAGREGRFWLCSFQHTYLFENYYFYRGYDKSPKVPYVRCRIRGTTKNPLNAAHLIIARAEWPHLHLGGGSGLHIHHIDGNPENNTIENLKPISYSVHRLLRKDIVNDHNKGVHYTKGWGYYCAHVQKGKIVITGSTTKDKKIALLTYDCISWLIHRENGKYYGVPNFPDIPIKDKWDLIGHKQYRQILHSIEKKGLINDFIIKETNFEKIP